MDMSPVQGEADLMTEHRQGEPLVTSGTVSVLGMVDITKMGYLIFHDMFELVDIQKLNASWYIYIYTYTVYINHVC